MQYIIDHGENDHLTPYLTEVDQAVARAIRRQIADEQNPRIPASLPQQLIRNGLSALDDPFAWLRS